LRIGPRPAAPSTGWGIGLVTGRYGLFSCVRARLRLPERLASRPMEWPVEIPRPAVVSKRCGLAQPNPQRPNTVSRSLGLQA